MAFGLGGHGCGHTKGCDTCKKCLKKISEEKNQKLNMGVNTIYLFFFRLWRKITNTLVLHKCGRWVGKIGDCKCEERK